MRKIATLLSRSPSSISSEPARNTGKRGYRPGQAHRLARERALRPGPRRFTEAVRLDAEARLREGWTPEIISGRARPEGRPRVCKETICKHVHADAKRGATSGRTCPGAAASGVGAVRGRMAGAAAGYRTSG